MRPLHTRPAQQETASQGCHSPKHQPLPAGVCQSATKQGHPGAGSMCLWVRNWTMTGIDVKVMHGSGAAVQLSALSLGPLQDLLHSATRRHHNKGQHAPVMALKVRLGCPSLQWGHHFPAKASAVQVPAMVSPPRLSTAQSGAASSSGAHRHNAVLQMLVSPVRQGQARSVSGRPQPPVPRCVRRHWTC